MSVASTEPAVEPASLNWVEPVALCPLGGGPLIPAKVVKGPDAEGDYRVSFKDTAPNGYLRGIQWFRPNGDPVGSTGHRVVQARPQMVTGLILGRDLGGGLAATAPYGCHVLAGRFVEDEGEWKFAVVGTPLCQPFTHWWPLPDLAATLFGERAV